MKVTDPSHLGVGRDVQAKDKYKALNPIAAWRVIAPARQAKYNIAKSELKEEVEMVKTIEALPLVTTKLDEAATKLGVDWSINEKLLLHGTRPETLLTILQNGLNERFSGGVFGHGSYLAEDPAKADQYCTPDPGRCDALRELHKRLYDELKLDHPGRVFYAVACRVVVAFPVFSKDGEANMSRPYNQMFATMDKRELATIPGSNPPIHYHTAIIESGPADQGFKLTRHREFVVYHSDHIFGEYVIAYTRSMTQAPLPISPTVIGSSTGPAKDGYDESPPGSVVVVIDVASPIHVEEPAPTWAGPAQELCMSVMKILDGIEASKKYEVHCAIQDKLTHITILLRSARSLDDPNALVDLSKALNMTAGALHGRVNRDKLWECARTLQEISGDLALLTMGKLAIALPYSSTSTLGGISVVQETLNSRKAEVLAVRRDRRRAAEKMRQQSNPPSGWRQYFPLFNKNYSIRAQLIVGILGGACIAVILFIIIMCSVTAGLAKNTKTTVKNSLSDNAKTNLLTTSSEMALSIESRFRQVGETLSMTFAEQMQVLYTDGFNKGNLSHPHPTLLKAQPSFADWGFMPGCSRGVAPGGCPPDFGDLDSRSRVPGTGFSGSVNRSSLYIYSSLTNSGGRTPTDWTTAMTNADVDRSIRVTAVMDADLQNSYYQGPKSTLMIYTAASVPSTPESMGYSWRRTFPGFSLQGLPDIQKPYNPASRGWFAHAAEGSLSMEGPYKETFTKLFVITLSAKRLVYIDGGSQPTQFVGGVVMLLSAIKDLVEGLTYLQSGFAVLAKVTGEVIFWGDTSANIQPCMDDPANIGKVICQHIEALDAGFSALDLSGGKSFEYTKQSPGRGQGELWFVAQVPFFQTATQSGAGASPVQNSLTLLMFARSSEVFATLPTMNTDIDNATNNIVKITLIGAIILVAIVAVAVMAVDQAIAPSLRFLLAKSKEVTQSAAADPEEGGKGRYRDLADGMPKLSSEQRALRRSSELGSLTVYFNSMVQRLGAAEQAKLEMPKFPKNPFVNRQEMIGAGRFVELQQACAHLVKEVSPLELEASRNKELMAAEARAEEASRGGGLLLTCSRCWGYFKSLRILGCMVAVLLIIGLIIIAVLALGVLTTNGPLWLQDSASFVEHSQLQNLASIATAKSVFTTSFFDGAALQTFILGDFATRLLTGQLTDTKSPSSISVGNSWSLDCACKDPLSIMNNFAYACNRDFPQDCATGSPNFSGYFALSDARCAAYATCGQTRDAAITTLSSLLDLKTKSFFHPLSELDFTQVAVESFEAASMSYTRLYPYSHKAYGSPPQSSSGCVYDLNPSKMRLQYSSVCTAGYQKCQSVSTSGGSYSPYDVRCRFWYQSALNSPMPKLGYQPPRKISSGGVDITFASSIWNSQNLTQLQGAVAVNIKTSYLSDSVNRLQILSTGYAFLVDLANPSAVIAHPLLTPQTGCFPQEAGPLNLSCIDPSWSVAELEAFRTDVLPVIATGQTAVYTKGGEEWKVAGMPVMSASADLLMIVTVRTSEVRAVVTKVQTDIDSAVSSQITACIIIVIVVGLFNMALLSMLILSVDRAIKELINACKYIAEGDLAAAHVPIPSRASSSDMAALLEAFSSMLLAFRFGSDFYAQGDMNRAMSVFTDAIAMFEALCNDRGAGIAYNNSAAVHTAMGQWKEAGAEYLLSIAIAQACLQVTEANYEGWLVSGSSDNPEHGKWLARTTRAAKKQLSNRVGNYAGMLIDSDDKSQDVISLLEYAQGLDEEIGNIYGWTVKQGIMANFYMRQQETSSAERCLRTAIERVKLSRLDAIQRNLLPDRDVELQELLAAEELADYSLARYFVKLAEKGGGDAYAFQLRAMALLGESLGSPAVHEPRTTAKALQLLRKLNNSEPQQQAITALSDMLGIKAVSVSSSKKRVAFLMDYSGSMAGSKIKAAVGALADVFDKFIKQDDLVMLAHFNSTYNVDFDFSEKQKGEAGKKMAIASLTNPDGGTRFFDSVKDALETIIKKPAPSYNNWIVALTDGDDSTSTQLTCKGLEQRLKVAKELQGLIVIAVGLDVKQEPLARLAKATEKGALVVAGGDPKSIADAFHQAAQMIETHVVLEDF